MKKILLIIFLTLIISSIMLATNTQNGKDSKEFSSFTYTFINTSSKPVKVESYNISYNGNIHFGNGNKTIILSPHSQKRETIFWTGANYQRNCNICSGFIINGNIANDDYKYVLSFKQTVTSRDEIPTRVMTVLFPVVKYGDYILKFTNNSVLVSENIS